MAASDSDPVSATRYKEKIANIGVDPYLLRPGEWDRNPSSFPPIAHGDIFSYLVL